MNNKTAEYQLNPLVFVCAATMCFLLVVSALQGWKMVWEEDRPSYSDIISRK